MWNFLSTGLRRSEITDFQPIFARSNSAITPSEKSSINTNSKSTTCFPISQRWSSYIALKSPKGGSKTQNGRFSSKIALAWRNSATKFLCVKTVSDKVEGHSLAQLAVQNDLWGRPFYRTPSNVPEMNAIIAFILCFFAAFDRFSVRLYHSGWR